MLRVEFIWFISTIFMYSVEIGFIKCSKSTNPQTSEQVRKPPSCGNHQSCSPHTGSSHYQRMFCQVWERTSHRSAYGCVLLIKNENNRIGENVLKYPISPKNLNWRDAQKYRVILLYTVYIRVFKPSFLIKYLICKQNINVFERLLMRDFTWTRDVFQMVKSGWPIAYNANQRIKDTSSAVFWNKVRDKNCPCCNLKLHSVAFTFFSQHNWNVSPNQKMEGFRSIM